MFKQRIAKTGTSLGILIPAREIEFEGFKEGEWVEVILKRVTKYSNQEEYEEKEKEEIENG